MTADRYLLAPEVAKRLGVKTSTLARWRRADPPRGPQGWVRYHQTAVAYPVTAIDAWLAACAAAPSPEPHESFRGVA